MRSALHGILVYELSKHNIVTLGEITISSRVIISVIPDDKSPGPEESTPKPDEGGATANDAVSEVVDSSGGREPIEENKELQDLDGEEAAVPLQSTEVAGAVQ